MDIKIINEMIEELEDSDTTYANTADLASLYIVRDKLQVNRDIVEKELTDILPSYCHYIDRKRCYQLNQTTKADVICAMTNVCIEIKEFIETLYNNSDFLEERDTITKLISSIDFKY